ncbi:MAG TPA: amidase family protein [Trebonia sp.]
MTATELAAAIRSKESSSTELVESYLDRIEALNPGLGAVVTVAAESARSEAREADRCLARGEGLGPMHGLPVTVKDCLETAGMRTTCGARELADYVPDNDAVAVRRLRRAGAIIVGKTNLPAWASDCQSYNELFGTTNPLLPGLDRAPPPPGGRRRRRPVRPCFPSGWITRTGASRAVTVTDAGRSALRDHLGLLPG